LETDRGTDAFIGHYEEIYYGHVDIYRYYAYIVYLYWYTLVTLWNIHLKAAIN